MKYSLILMLAFMMSMCNSGKKLPESVNALAPLLVYKTKADYSQNIPIVFDAEKNTIVSYPAIGDVSRNGAFALPSELNDGYLLDNLGLSSKSVYTSFTFESYSKRAKEPTIEEWKQSIIDDDPFIALYSCGKRVNYKSIKELNEIIKRNFQGCDKIK